MAKIKGLCHNYDGCDLAETKVVQEVDETNFICEECGKELYSLDENSSVEPKGKKKKGLIMASVAVVILLAGGSGAAIKLLGAKDKSEDIGQLIEQHIGQYKLAWGDYTGPLDANELPDGNGGSVLVTHDFVLTINDELIKVVPQDTVIKCVFNKGEFVTGYVLNSHPIYDFGDYDLEWGVYNGPLTNNIPDGEDGEVYVRKNVSLSILGTLQNVEEGDKIENCVFENGKIVSGKIIRKKSVAPDSGHVPSNSDPKPESPYASWTGAWKDGQPHGQGTLTYAKHYMIDPRVEGVYAEKGDYVMGEFEKGYLVVGTLHRTDGRVQQFNNGKLPAGSPARK